MTTLEILWIISTALLIWRTYFLIQDSDDGLFVFPLLLSLISVGWMVHHFLEQLTTPLW